jgi:hypothetical protein
LRDLYLAEPHPLLLVDYHSFQELILHPWAYTLDPPPDQALLAGTAGFLAAEIQRVHGHEYEVGPASSLYLHSGTAIDWGYGTWGVPSLAVELRPHLDAVQPTGFLLSPEEILPTCEENAAALLALAWLLVPDAQDPENEDSSGGSSTDTPGRTGSDSVDSATSSWTSTVEGPSRSDLESAHEPGPSEPGRVVVQPGCTCRTEPLDGSWAGWLILGLPGWRRTIRAMS